MRCLLLRFSLLWCCILFLLPAFAQLGTITFDLQKDKPEKFKTKTLKSETTGDKKFTLKRRISQNTVSHYNYYFNANNKLNEVIERARLSNKDDYGKLLSFYGYSLNTTATQKTDLDSVIYKATAGILLHDLRSDWVDNFYLLIGKAYLMQKEFDSAGMTFQFINYNLFPRKRKGDDFPPVVGSNTGEGNNYISIASKEKRSLVDKAFTRPPSRNDALIWQIRTFIEQKEYTDAASLINTLQNDPNFPDRLQPDLEELNAYWFYNQNMYDSAAVHLEKALSAANDRQDKARWEYLLAQLFEMVQQPDKASRYYTRAMHHTTDPMLDIYANLNNAKIFRGNDPREYNNTIDNLVKMAKKDKYENYREIVYYSAGELALQKPDTAAAEFMFKKSLTYNETNTAYKNKAWLQLADIAYAKKDYQKAAAYYDSIQVNDPSLTNRAVDITERKVALAGIVKYLNIIQREDSLQRIATLPPDQRDAFINRELARLRKEKGIKDDQLTTYDPFGGSRTVTDPFASTSDKGDWYFYNPAVKSKGFTDFHTKWGNRLNVDNWRRGAALNGNTPVLANSLNTINTTDNKSSVNNELSYTAMLGNLPTTPEKMDSSNSMMATSLFELGKLYQNSLEDYTMAVKEYETSLQRFPNKLYDGELYFNLAYCYQKLGDASKAAYYKNLLTTAFKSSSFAQAVSNPASIKAQGDPAITKRYENIYNLFLEGQFEKAVADKRAADSLYGKNYWSPQLLYIESVYLIRQRQDSLALETLNNIIYQYPSSPLRPKVETMIDVLKRRSQIENYLTNLQVTRRNEDAPLEVKDAPADRKPAVVQDKPVQQPVANQPEEKKEVVVPKPVTPPPANGTFSFNAAAPQNVVMVLDKVDGVYVGEARNAFNRYNRENFAGQNIEIARDTIDKDRNILIFSRFPDATAAMAYTERIRKSAASEVSWLPAAKYSFIIISDDNLQLLKSNKDLAAYLSLLRAQYPGKF